MRGPALSVPAKRTSGWVAETDPKYAQAWLDALPLANSGEAAREIYQALYTINRLTLPVRQRLELMELYQKPIATVCTALQAHLARAPQPLGPKKRQLAEFVRRLYLETAYGYKCCLQDVSVARFQWRRGALLARCAERALYYSREVLVRSYLVYMPYPGSVWKEIHEIYRFAEADGVHQEPVKLQTGGGERSVTVRDRYLQTLLLGISQPYQLPPNDCLHLLAFLEQWGARAELRADLSVANPAGQFVVDFAADAPPHALPRGKMPEARPDVRLLNAMEVVAVAQGFIARLRKGEPVAALALGIDCLDEICLDLLQRLVSVWGLTPRRRFKRIRRNSYVSVCLGLHALHFFTDGQRLLVPGGVLRAAADGDSAGVETPRPTRPAAATCRVDRWHVRDTGPQGMLLARYGDMGASVRVGELLGLQEVGGSRWSAAVVRWLKSPESQSLELGVELLAPDVKPVAIRATADGAYAEALLVPETTEPRRPASLLVARGAVAEGRQLYLLERGRPPRLVRALKLLERTSAYQRLVFADVATNAPV